MPCSYLGSANKEMKSSRSASSSEGPSGSDFGRGFLEVRATPAEMLPLVRLEVPFRMVGAPGLFRGGIVVLADVWLSKMSNGQLLAFRVLMTIR